MGLALIQPPLAKRKKSARGAMARSIHAEYRPSGLLSPSPPSTPRGAASCVPAAATKPAARPAAASSSSPGSAFKTSLGRVDVAHRQSYAPLTIHLENLDPNHIAF